MTKIQALKQALNGKMVYHISWSKGYIYWDGQCFIDHKNRPINLTKYEENGWCVFNG